FQRERIPPLRTIKGDDRDRPFSTNNEVHADALALARNSFLRILPVAVRGSAPNSTSFGHLKCDSRSRLQAISSSADSDAPGFNPTYAFGTSPHFSSGAATIATSATAG